MSHDSGGDTRGTWFDASALKDATDDQVQRVVIPPGLYPNAASFYFSLDSRRHRIYVETYSKGKSLTINSAHKLFSELAAHPRIVEKFGHAKISIVQDKAALEAMFSIDRIREIQITIPRPNPDVFSDDFESKIEAHLAETNSKKMVVKYEAEQGLSLVPDDDIRAASGAALEKGNVQVKGRDDNVAVKLSSDKFPRVLQTTFDPDETGAQEAFVNLTADAPDQ